MSLCLANRKHEISHVLTGTNAKFHLQTGSLQSRSRVGIGEEENLSSPIHFEFFSKSTYDKAALLCKALPLLYMPVLLSLHLLYLNNTSALDLDIRIFFSHSSHPKCISYV